MNYSNDDKEMCKLNLPLVSIITPSYNQGEFIEETILSVREQDYPKIEHIVVDGGSKDNTVDILKDYEDTYNMQWISEPDDGQVDAIIKGFDMAEGSILTWLNSDDYYLNNQVITKVIDYFRHNKKVYMITGNGHYVGEKGNFLTLITSKKKRINLKFMKYGDFMLQPSTFFKKEVTDIIYLDRQYSYAFDWIFFLEIFEKGFDVLVVDDFFSAYRKHSKHKTGEDNAKRKKEIANIAKRNFGIYNLQTVYCNGIFKLYSFCEFLPGPIGSLVKAFIRIVNSIISKITFYRIYSC